MMQAPDDMTNPRWNERRRRLFIGVSLVVLFGAILARYTGPSDVWHQTQPKTVSYTTGIIVHGGSHWILPQENGGQPATKPPLYNWLAVPFVKGFGFSSEAAHKAPSLLGMIGCFVLLVRLGNRLDEPHRLIGWVAGGFFVANYSIFKLGYLARPDMLLTLWLLLAWIAGTRLLTKKENTKLFSMAILFWSCIALAILTKGPPALLPLLYVLFASRLVGGSWRSLARLQAGWGLPFAVVLAGAWGYGVWRIDPGHLREELWFNEIYGRVTGASANLDAEDANDWAWGLHKPFSYFMVRFAPWSLAVLFFSFWLPQRGEAGGIRNWRTLDEAVRPWIMGAYLYLLLVIVFFAVSAGLRADYIASALAPGSLLGAWWLLRITPFLGVRTPWLIPFALMFTLVVLVWADRRQFKAYQPYPGFASNIQRFIDEASVELERRPAEAAFRWTLRAHAKAFLGFSEPDDPGKIDRLIERGEPFWVLAGQRRNRSGSFENWFRNWHPDHQITLVVQSEATPRDEETIEAMYNRQWPGRMSLYWIIPTPAPGSTPATDPPG